MSTALPPLPRYPSLYQINTRVWLTELSRAAGRPATLDDVYDRSGDDLCADGLYVDVGPWHTNVFDLENI